MNDLISRQAAIDALDKRFDSIPMEQTTEILLLRKDLRNLPSAQPQRMRGKWVHGREIAREMVGDAVAAIFYEGWQCSECKCIVEEEREPLWNYCPNCGARMEAKENEND